MISLSSAPGRLLVATVQVATICQAAADDWPRWRGPNLDGISRETGWSATALEGEPKIVWRARVGTGFSSFVVADGRVFTTGNTADTDTLFCLDADTGRELWKYSHAEPLNPRYYDGGTSATPTVDRETVYQLSRAGQLAALNTRSGEVRWQKNIATELGAAVPEWGFAGAPFVLGDRLILNVGTHGTALEKSSGKVVWTTGKEASGYSTPLPFTAGGQSGLAIFAAKEFVGVDPLSGRKLWSFPWETKYDVNAAAPIFSGDRVFISSGYRKGGALLDLANGQPKEVWAGQNMHNQFNSSVLIGGHLYGISGQDGKPEAGLACVEFATGELKWKEEAVMFGALTAANNQLIVISEKGELIIADANPARFVARSRGQVLGGRCWTAPVLANGRVYVRNSKGDVVCVDVKE